MKKLLLTITTLFLGLFTIASCDINQPNPDKVKNPETTQGNEKKEDKTNDKTKDKVEDKVEDKDKEKEKEPKTTEEENTTETGDNKQEEPSTSDNGAPSNGETLNEVGTGETGTNENGSSTNENGTSDSTPSSEPSTSDERTNGEEPSTNDGGITSDGRLTPEETARRLAFIDKRVEIKKRLNEDSKLNNSPEGIALARTIAPNWDMRYKTDLMGRPVDEFYLLIGTIERRKMASTHALNYGWQRINEERYNN